jgi:hypothetical protein
MIQFLRFATYVGLAVALAPVAVVLAVGDAVTDGRLTGDDYVDPYDPEHRCADRQYYPRPGGGYWTKDQMP